MGAARIRHLMLVAAAAVVLATLASPALGVETKLAGIMLGDTRQDLQSSPSFGTPHAMFTPGNAFSFVNAYGTEAPPWAMAVQMAGVGPDQVQWIYNRDPVVIGVLLTGTGGNARVTNIVVSQWRNFKPSQIAETTKGIRLGDTFAEVLEAYGWPNRMEVISETGSAAPAARPQTARPAVARPAVARPAGAALFGATGRAAEAGKAATLQELLGTPGLPGPGALPSVGAPATVSRTPATSAYTTAASGINFSKSCILSYPSVDFLIHRMLVFRIHVYGR